MKHADAARAAWAKVDKALDGHGDSPEYRAAWAELERLVRRESEPANQGCRVPPAGWWCSREPGHDGPCAARAEPHVAEEADHG